MVNGKYTSNFILLDLSFRSNFLFAHKINSARPNMLNKINGMINMRLLSEPNLNVKRLMKYKISNIIDIFLYKVANYARFTDIFHADGLVKGIGYFIFAIGINLYPANVLVFFENFFHEFFR